MPIVPRMTVEDLQAFKPLGNNVVIKKYQKPSVTDAGIHMLPDTKDYQCKRGTIVAMSAGVKDKAKKLKISEGAEVVFSAFSGKEFPMPEGYLIMEIDELLAVLETK